MQDALREICFPSWNWMHFTHNGIKLTIPARHQLRVHGCHSCFRGTMNADEGWGGAVTVDTIHDGTKDRGLTYNTNYNTQEDYTLSGLSHDTMDTDFKSILCWSPTFYAVGCKCLCQETFSSSRGIHFEKCGASWLCHTGVSSVCRGS